MTWTKEEDETLVRMWAIPINTAVMIAVELGNKTKNAVIGRAHRLHLATRKTGTKLGSKKSPSKTKRIRPSKRHRGNCHISDLTNQRCHDVLDPISNLMYCGKPTVDGVWCQEHRDLYYSKGGRR